MEIAEADPKGLTWIREQATQHSIDAAAPDLRQRLVGLQFQINS